MRLQDIHKVYFLGVGGIGMSAMARWFLRQGYHVSGYDRTPSALTAQLEQEGIYVHFDDSVEALPEDVRQSVEGTLVVYTPAIPATHPAKLWLEAQGYTLYKRSEVLGMITKNQKTLAVAGTHGKTTTSSMLAHLLKVADIDSGAFMGGIATNYDSNVLFSLEVTADTPVVVEADEFDRSFMRLHPFISIITAMDADHLDIYGSAEEMHRTFGEFARKVPAEGTLFVHHSLLQRLGLPFDFPVRTYGIDQGDVQARHLRAEGDRFVFDFHGLGQNIYGLSLGVPGFHNVENAVAAIAVALKVGATPEAIAQGMATYAGVKRRFEYVVRTEDLVFVDDYAHHPVEIEALLKSLRTLYPSRTLTVIFQPHLYTRTRDFAAGFSQSLSLADQVWLLPIYPAREEPIAGVESEMLLEDITCPVRMVTKEELPALAAESALQVLATVGAGDIDRLVQPIAEKLTQTHA